jgi:hypothetical protein
VLQAGTRVQLIGHRGGEHVEHLIGSKARTGTVVRIILGDADSAYVDQRGNDEGIHDAMAAKIRNAILLYRPLLAADVEIRLHSTVLYNSLYRSDDEMLINRKSSGIPWSAARAARGVMS